MLAVHHHCVIVGEVCDDIQQYAQDLAVTEECCFDNSFLREQWRVAASQFLKINLEESFTAAAQTEIFESVSAKQDF